MANPKRVARVQQQLKREISSLLLTDKVLRKAVYPNEAAGADSSLSSLASVTDVLVSNDLQVVKVYISIYGETQGQHDAMAALQGLQSYTRKKIGARITLRRTPEVRYIADDSFHRATNVLSILDKLQAERDASNKSSSNTDSSTETGDDSWMEEWEEEDDDEDVFLIDEEEDTDSAENKMASK
ncbi:hypothetical protein CYMTET_23995 [Cymbomonas tetramitiformis]|uniref:Ribosome-binding factor A n=1 Tax=Cymbomonas tetramitiformis TaxID=36881 RepID=A0AAE0FWS4_9CHLO|nr:hypothetical protein CYMTET_23995 [Cymbomonas tetramitiformis]